MSVETFTEVQLLRRTKAAGGLGTARQEHGGRAVTKSPYLLRGMVRCGVCGRKMQGATIRKGVYYRCIARTLAPGSLALRSASACWAAGQHQPMTAFLDGNQQLAGTGKRGHLLEQCVDLLALLLPAAIANPALQVLAADSRGSRRRPPR